MDFQWSTTEFWLDPVEFFLGSRKKITKTNGVCVDFLPFAPPPKKKENDVDRQGLRKNPETMGYNPQKTEPCCHRLMFNRFGNRVDRANHGLFRHR